MAQSMDYVEYLSKEIGARPAGTEEEQQAALYIADEFQKEAGFSASIEEFTSSSNLEGGRAILAMVTIVVSVLAMLFNVLTGPAFILALIAAVIYALEAYDRPVLSKLLSRGASQNVVAKYQPGDVATAGNRPARKRKIVLVAHYDTGKVTPKLISRVESMGLPLGTICLGGMAAAAFFLLLRIFIGGTGGVGLIFINILTIIAILIVALPIVKAIMYRVAPYNEGANNNATGVAALLEVARRIGSGSVSEADLIADGWDYEVHGEEAALESGYVPEGAELIYDTDRDEYAEDYSEEDRLLAAKAAIAALTGKPVEQRVYVQEGDARPTPRTREPFAGFEADEQDDAVFQDQAVMDYSTLPTPAAVVAPKKEEAVGFENAPSWFVAAQRNAKRSESSEPVQRSRYTEAIQAAEQTLANKERQREEEERERRAQELREREEATRAAISAMRSSAADEEQAPEPEPEPEQSAAQQEIEFAPIEYDAEPSAIPDIPVIDAPEVAAPEAPAPETQQQAQLDFDEELVEPAPFEEVLAANDDLGATIAYTPEMIRQAIAEEMAEAQAAQAETAAVADERPQRNLGRIADLRIGDETAPVDPEVRKSLSALPSFEDSAEASAVPENDNPSRSGLFRMLRSDVPSLSGALEPVEDEAAPKPSPLESAAIPRITLDSEVEEEPASDEGKTVAIDYDMQLPVSDELVDAANEAYEGDFAAPNQVEIPKSRAGRLFGRKSRNDDLTTTPQEWLDVDDDFEARKVGRERGSWESFREDDGSWEGGALSRVHLDHVNLRSGDGESADEPEEMAEALEDQMLNEEIEQIYHFRNPDYNSEIWFVAIGSDTELHDGAKAFVEEHKSELRGAMIIEVESLGVGELSVASEEGRFKKIQASSRIKRFTRAATEVTGIVLGQVKLATDSITTTIQKAGFQAMHLVGIENGAPALKGSADDIVENVDEMILEENINYLMELLRQD